MVERRYGRLPKSVVSAIVVRGMQTKCRVHADLVQDAIEHFWMQGWIDGRWNSKRIDAFLERNLKLTVRYMFWQRFIEWVSQETRALPDEIRDAVETKARRFIGSWMICRPDDLHDAFESFMTSVTNQSWTYQRSQIYLAR